MAAAGVPSAARLDEPSVPCVIKADGLAAGKGVFVCRTHDELEVAIPPAAQDYKRLRDGDEGPNTGGMGAYSPIAHLGPDQVEQIVESVHRPVLAELARRGAPFVGLLYAGLMLTEQGPKVLEFNCRFGDPETQVVVPLLESDVLELLAAAASGDLHDLELAASEGAAISVVLASAGYPEASERGVELRGVEEAESAGALVFHAGTARRDDVLLSAGGRVLDVTALGKTIEEARERAYRAIDYIHFPGVQFRRDIGLGATHVGR
jgi:phosphoribosylamine--glycine ligase